MRRRLIASACGGSPSARFYGNMPTQPLPPTLEQLERELEVLRGKLRTLTLAQHRHRTAAPARDRD